MFKKDHQLIYLTKGSYTARPGPWFIGWSMIWKWQQDLDFLSHTSYL